MEILSQYSDSFLVVPDCGSGDTHDTTRNSYSDEEVMLAANHPKKQAGRRKFKETRHPVFRGIRKRDKNRWVCELREPKKKSRIWLGTYPTAEMAARAHDVAALALRGHMACLNFADSAWRLPVPVSSTANDIQRAAAAAAEAFRPQPPQTPEGSDGASSDDVKQEILRKSKNVEKLSIETENIFYMDEEAMFNMPGLLVNMAEGLLISPPSCLYSSAYTWDDMESDVGVPLWSYSM